MDLTHSAEQLELGAVARSLFTRECPTSLVRQLREPGSDGLAPTLWQALASAGIFGIPFEEKYGGAGAGQYELGLVFEQAGRALCPTIVYSTMVFGLGVARLGGDQLKSRYLPDLVEGRLRASHATWNPSNAADLRSRLSALRVADGWLLSGRLLFVQNAQAVDVLMVTARTSVHREPERTYGFLIQPGGAGWLARALMTIAHDQQSEVVLSDYFVADDAVLTGPDGTGLAEGDLAWLANSAIALQCMEMVGGTAAVIEQTVAYTKVREQFGRPIGSFQAVQHLVADMRIALDAARLTATQAAWWTGRGEIANRAVAIAKMKCNEAYKWATLNCHQLQGGMGYVLDTDLHLWSSRAKLTELQGGTTDTAALWLERESGLI
jgi:alkylation response protein AidB-like acyl-CoA dehydrogenase